MRPVQKRLVEFAAWAVLSAAIGYFFLRDVPQYATYTPESYGRHWEARSYLIPHILGAGVGILVGLAQFSSTIRQRWPAIHRLCGRVYVAACVIGAPAAMLLATKSNCETCKPALGSLGVYWLVTTMVAFYFARNRSFATHRAFMIRSYVAMNVFVVVRIGDLLAGDRANEMSVRTMVEFSTVLGSLLFVESYLAWTSEIRLGNAIVRKRQAQAPKLS